MSPNFLESIKCIIKGRGKAREKLRVFELGIPFLCKVRFGKVIKQYYILSFQNWGEARMGCLSAQGRVSKNTGVRCRSLKNTGLEISPATPSNLHSEPLSVRGQCYPPNRWGGGMSLSSGKWSTGYTAGIQLIPVLWPFIPQVPTVKGK